jgi:hypothetical protein
MFFLSNAPRRASLSIGPRPALIAITAALGLVIGLPAAASASAIRPAAGTATASAGTGVRHACAAPDRRGVAACLVLVRTNVPQRPQAQIRPDQAPAGVGYGPASLQGAYNLPSATAGWGQTVAVVDAYDYPSAAADLATYRSDWGLPACNTATGAGCLTKVNENGQASPLPAAAGATGWATEEALDIEMVAATCPNCRILLVEANSASIADLGTAVNSAVTLGAKYVSNSYGSAEYSGETSSDSSYYNHPGVAVTAAAGDYGYGVSYPAASQDVVSVGGTTLNSAANPRGWTETAWSGSGSGCSAYEPKPSWQTDTGCARRTDNDVAAVADPNTGVAVYDTYDQGGWLEVGGTSVASPIIASTYALAGVPAAGTYPASYLYAHPASLNDITSGSDGTCTPAYLCTAGPGYDGPTGMGTPNGTGAFTAATVARVLGAGAAGKNANGNLQVFARGSNGGIWSDLQATTAWGGWTSFGGPATFTAPTVAQNAGGQLEVFDVAANGQMYHDFQTAPNGGWSGWSSIGGTLSYAAPAVGRNSNGSLELFAKGTDGAVWTATQSSSSPSGWTSWSSMGGSVTSPPVVGQNVSGYLEIFATGTGGAVFHDYQTVPNGGWSGWSSIGGSLAAATPSVGLNTNGSLEVFALGTNGAVWTATQSSSSGSGWTAWSSLGSSVTGPPALGQNSDGRLEVFAPAAGGQVVHAYQTTPSGSFSAWASLAGNVTSSPAVVLNSGGGLEIFAPAPGGAVSYDVQTATPNTWAAWASLG